MQTVLNRAGGAIPRLFVFLAAATVVVATPAMADFGGNLSRRIVTASWYGPGFSGRLTASGSRFDPRGMTAAHKTLPAPNPGHQSPTGASRSDGHDRGLVGRRD
jgi:hypothetical protein